MAEVPRELTPQALERFRSEFDAKYPKAVVKLEKDWKLLTAFYDFPAGLWRHLRTPNPIESRCDREAPHQGHEGRSGSKKRCARDGL